MLASMVRRNWRNSLLRWRQVQFADHLTAGDVQRREQRRCAVAHVVVGTPFRNAGGQRQDRLGTIQRLNLALLVDAQHQRFGRRCEDLKPTMSRTLSTNCGSVESLKVSWR